MKHSLGSFGVFLLLLMKAQTQLPMKLETPTETIVRERKTKKRAGSVSRYKRDHFKGRFRKASPALATAQNRPQAQKR